MAKKKMSFEESLSRLEEIVSKMENGNTSLEESLKLFEEGNALVVNCSSMLKEAELKVTRLLKGQNGEPVEEEVEDEYKISE